jgi:hypothetical protein
VLFIAVELAEVLATAFITSAVINPSKALRPVTVEVFLTLAEEEVFSVKTVESVPSALSVPFGVPSGSVVATLSTVLERVLPPVPWQGQGWKADLPSWVATGPACALAKVA